ncbi:MAG: hypothetical protein AN482_19355 [Anabaena sp. LE011-02]|nr:MAG: hypothetical protein AN482_19355 [Anabaena sp. LE011-02]
MLVAYALIVAKNCLNQDVQDVFLIFIHIFRSCILSESGCPGFEDVQDVFLILIYIFRNWANSNIPQYQTQIQSC